MHYRLLVTFNKDHADTSEDARRHALSELEGDASFLGGGRFHSGFADWFVIGGRWSGELSRATWARDVQKEVADLEAKEKVQVWGTHYGNSEKQATQARVRAQVETLYARALPDEYRDKGLKYTRDTYLQLGYEDDAMLVTGQLYERLLAEFEGQHTVESKYILPFADLNYDVVKSDFVGTKWLVVIDAHI